MWFYYEQLSKVSAPKTIAVDNVLPKCSYNKYKWVTNFLLIKMLEGHYQNITTQIFSTFRSYNFAYSVLLLCTRLFQHKKLDNKS